MSVGIIMTWHHYQEWVPDKLSFHTFHSQLNLVKINHTQTDPFLIASLIYLIPRYCIAFISQSKYDQRSLLIELLGALRSFF